MAEIEFSIIKSPWGKSNHLLPLLETFEKAYCVHVNLTSIGRGRLLNLKPVGLAIWLPKFTPQEIYTIDSTALFENPDQDQSNMVLEIH